MFSLRAQIIFVKAGGNGNGSSWDKACDLHTALRLAKAGHQIWVAAGTYLPTTVNDRNASFQIQDGVQLFGGFAGFETSVQQRDLAGNLSILSGEIGNPNNKEDNSFTVVYTKNVSENTVIDGFVIQSGMANGTGEKGDIKRCGAGWFNDGSNGRSNPQIRNCLFINNFGRDGAALYNYAVNGEASPLVYACRFVGNQADLDGGAIFNDGSNGICNAVIESCLFQDNKSTYGAGILNLGTNGETRPEIRNCQFFGNVSYIRGSSVYNNRQDSGICSPVISGCLFEDNHASVGRDVSSTINNSVANERAKSSVVYKAGY